MAAQADTRGGDKRVITQSDILDFHWVTSPQISPDGAKIVYTYVSVNAKKDDTAQWIVPAAGATAPRQLTSGTHDGGAAWSPDGKTIAFIRTEAVVSPAADGRRPIGQIYLLPLQGGEARALTDLPRGAGMPVWSPDGKSIAFTSTVTAKDLDHKDGPTGRAVERRSRDFESSVPGQRWWIHAGRTAFSHLDRRRPRGAECPSQSPADHDRRFR